MAIAGGQTALGSTVELLGEIGRMAMWHDTQVFVGCVSPLDGVEWLDSFGSHTSLLGDIQNDGSPLPGVIPWQDRGIDDTVPLISLYPQIWNRAPDENGPYPPDRFIPDSREHPAMPLWAKSQVWSAARAIQQDIAEAHSFLSGYFGAKNLSPNEQPLVDALRPETSPSDRTRLLRNYADMTSADRVKRAIINQAAGIASVSGKMTALRVISTDERVMGVVGADDIMKAWDTLEAIRLQGDTWLSPDFDEATNCFRAALDDWIDIQRTCLDGSQRLFDAHIAGSYALYCGARTGNSLAMACVLGTMGQTHLNAGHRYEAGQAFLRGAIWCLMDFDPVRAKMLHTTVPSNDLLPPRLELAGKMLTLLNKAWGEGRSLAEVAKDRVSQVSPTIGKDISQLVEKAAAARRQTGAW